MAQNFNLGTDYSKDFLNKMYSGNMNNSNTMSGSSSVNDAPAIPQKSTGPVEPRPLVSSYYDLKKNNTEGIRVKSPENNQVSKNYKSVQSASTALKNSAKELSRASLYEAAVSETKDPVTGSVKISEKLDRNRIAGAVSAFVDNYNKTLDSFNNTNNPAIRKKGEFITRFTAASANQLSKAGINVEPDNTLSLDRDKLDEANAGDLKSLFNGNNSFGQSIAERAGQIEGMSRNTINKISRMYDGAGQYKAAFNPDSIISNYF